MCNRSWRRSVEPAANALAGPLLDPVFELVDLVVQVVDEVEEALGDLVEEVVRDHARGKAVAARLLHRAEVDRRAVGWCLAHGEDRVLGEDQVDLLVVHAVLGYDLDRHEEDPEDVAAVALELRPGFVVVPGRREEIFHGQVMDRMREGSANRLLVGVEQIDPIRSIRRHDGRR